MPRQGRQTSGTSAVAAAVAVLLLAAAANTPQDCVSGSGTYQTCAQIGACQKK
jgi:hypothetical protein